MLELHGTVISCFKVTRKQVRYFEATCWVARQNTHPVSCYMANKSAMLVCVTDELERAGSGPCPRHKVVKWLKHSSPGQRCCCCRRWGRSRLSIHQLKWSADLVGDGRWRSRGGWVRVRDLRAWRSEGVGERGGWARWEIRGAVRRVRARGRERGVSKRCDKGSVNRRRRPLIIPSKHDYWKKHHGHYQHIPRYNKCITRQTCSTIQHSNIYHLYIWDNCWTCCFT